MKGPKKILLRDHPPTPRHEWRIERWGEGEVVSSFPEFLETEQQSLQDEFQGVLCAVGIQKPYLSTIRSRSSRTMPASLWGKVNVLPGKGQG